MKLNYTKHAKNKFVTICEISGKLLFSIMKRSN